MSPFRLEHLQFCTFREIVTILHPWQRDTGKYAAQGPNIMSPEAPLMPPEARRAELEGRGCDIDIII